MFHIVMILLSIVVAYVLVDLVKRYAYRLNHVAVPNKRSSHTRPTPTSGGLGIFISVISLWFVGVWLWPGQADLPLSISLVFPLIAVTLAVIGWLDDFRSLPARVRLTYYGAASAVFLTVVGPIHQIDLPYLGEIMIPNFLAFVLTWIWLLGFINIFNFMDGIDGLAGSQAVIAGSFWLLVFILEEQTHLAFLVGLVTGASLGFLFHNWSPARIFMGDVGSVFLGFVFAAVPILGYVETGNPRMLVTGALFVAPFVLDGGFTILYRALRGENVLTPHRTHLYQRLVIAGLSHSTVTKEYQLLMCLSGLCGLAYYSLSDELMLLSLFLGISPFIVYALFRLNSVSKLADETHKP